MFYVFEGAGYDFADETTLRSQALNSFVGSKQCFCASFLFARRRFFRGAESGTVVFVV